jgi:hypothetical protein
MERIAMFRGCLPGFIASALVITTAPALAQLPSAQLTSVFPPGGPQAASVEVTIAGSDLDDAERLVFSHRGITAAPKTTEPSAIEPVRPVANVFIVAIDGAVPPGIYEVRALSRFGLSNPRSFVVGSHKEITDAAGNAAADKALDVPLGTTVNGRVDASTYDFLRLKLKEGERVLIDVSARRIDSRLDATLIVFDAKGRELKRVKEGADADPVLDFTAPASGEYLLKLYDEVYGGGNDYFYRLTVSQAPLVDFVFPPSGLAGTTSPFTLFGHHLPGGKPAGGLIRNGLPLERLTVDISLPAEEAEHLQLALSGSAPLARVWQDAIEYRLPAPHQNAAPVPIYFAKAPRVVLEAEPNSDAQSAQKLSVPCECAGQFYPQSDFDWFEFEAKKGQTYWIEVISNQLGLPTDPFFAVYRVTKNDKGEMKQTEIAQIDDLPERGRRPTASDEFDLSSDDPAYKFVAPDDGTYRLLVRDQFGDSRQDPAMVYRLVIRSPEPDYRLLAYPAAPSPTQQQQNRVPLAAVNLRRGGTAAINLAVKRQDEFDGEIAIDVQGLPRGVTCPGAVLGGSVNDGALVLVAAEDAAGWAGPIRIVGKAMVAGRQVTREACYAVVVWGTPNRQQQPGEFRLAPELTVGVIAQELEPALVRIGASQVYETALGGSLEIPIEVKRRGDAKDTLKLVATGLSQPMKPKDVTLAGGKSEGKLELALNSQNIRPGSYTFYMKGETKHKYARNPEAVAAAEAEQKRLAETIKTINDEIKSATAAKNEAALKAAQEKLKTATERKGQCDKRLDDAKKTSQPKDVAVAMISTPVRLRIHASPIKLTAAPLAQSLKPGSKQPLAVNVDRLYGFADAVDLALSPPAGVKGLSAESVTLKKGEASGSLQIVAAENAPPGEHICTLKARGKFGNVPFESTETVTVAIDKP